MNLLGVWVSAMAVVLIFQFPSNHLLGQSKRPLSVPAVKKTIKKLASLSEKLDEPQPGEWLSAHKETGQTFAQYLRIRPNVFSASRNKLYIQPIGEFSEKQNELVKRSAEFLSIYFNCQVETLATKDETGIPEKAKRIHPHWGDAQLLTSHILEKVLVPELPRDAFAVIAFTTSDLWPGDGWNFVFGYASFRERVGVWSLYRYGDPNESEEAFRKCLARTLKVASHETGHMFSIQHCIAYQCNMQGSNSLPESDGQPIHLCPECHAKIVYATGCDPVLRYAKLIQFCRIHGLNEELKFYQSAKSQLERKSGKTRDGND